MHDDPPGETPVKRKILVVDDEPINIQVMHRTFSQDHQVFMATSGEQAIVTAMRQQPDIILLDVSMPGMDGFTTCERLKAELSTRDIPVIFVTAHNDPVRETRGLEVGAVDFISKPINPPLVRARVANHIALKVQSDRLRQMVFVDGETGCYNRRYFDSRLSVEWGRARRSQCAMSLILIALPRHPDENRHLLQLKQLASCVQVHLKRPGDLMARWDDNHLACVLPETGAEGARALAASILASAQEAPPMPSAQATPGPSLREIRFGMASWLLKGDHTVDDLVALAQAPLQAPPRPESDPLHVAELA